MGTSNSWHTSLATISCRGVIPSAARQMVLATSFSVKKVESSTDMTMVSRARTREAMAELRAMYVAVIGDTSNQQLPNRGVLAKSQLPHRNALHKLVCALENGLHQRSVA